MRDFNELKDQGRIEDVREDRAKGRGLIDRANRRFENQKEREVTDRNAFEILENVYESIREAIEAGMAVQGLKSNDHVAVIAYAREFLGLERSDLNTLHKFRKLRNESRYEALEVEVREAEQITVFADNVLPKIIEKVEEDLD